MVDRISSGSYAHYGNNSLNRDTTQESSLFRKNFDKLMRERASEVLNQEKETFTPKVEILSPLPPPSPGDLGYENFQKNTLASVNLYDPVEKKPVDIFLDMQSLDKIKKDFGNIEKSSDYLSNVYKNQAYEIRESEGGESINAIKKYSDPNDPILHASINNFIHEDEDANGIIDSGDTIAKIYSSLSKQLSADILEAIKNANQSNMDSSKKSGDSLMSYFANNKIESSKTPPHFPS